MPYVKCACCYRTSAGFELRVDFESDRLVTAICGPSGSGKSTLLRLLAGLLRPHSGTLVLPDAGRILVDAAGRICLPPERRQVGMVFQEHLLFPHLTVRNNLQYGRRQTRATSRLNFRDVVEILELELLLDRFPHQLSGGESQRVALGRALLSHPDLLLLDEPVSALDEALKSRILGYVERIVSRWELPTVFVSHDQAEVQRLAEWVVLLEGGQQMASGPTREIFSQPQHLSLRQEAGPLNLLRVMNVRTIEGARVGRAGCAEVHLPPPRDSANIAFAPASAKIPAAGGDVAPATAGDVWVSFSPRDVMLATCDVAQISARNHWRGMIRQIVNTAAGTFVAVDLADAATGSLLVWAEVTAPARDELGLAVGTEVICLVKSQALVEQQI